MLNPNPEKRVGLDDIFQHSWFLKDLPPGALGMNDWWVAACLLDAGCLPSCLLPAARCLHAHLK